MFNNDDVVVSKTTGTVYIVYGVGANSSDGKERILVKNYYDKMTVLAVNFKKYDGGDYDEVYKKLKAGHI